MSSQYIVTVDETGKVIGQPTPYQAQTQTQQIDSGQMSTAQIVEYSVLGAAILFVIIAFFLSYLSVKQQTVKIIERFGKFRKIVRAGLNFKVPFLDTVAGEMDLRVQQLNVEVETKTKDNVFVTVPIAVQYYIAPETVYDAFYKLSNPTAQISSYVFDAVRAQVPAMSLDEVYEKKNDIANNVKTELLETMKDYGYGITTALVTDISPAQEVRDAMNQINAQQRLREAATQKGEADKIIKVKAAEAEAESKALQGKGIANQRKAIIEGLQNSVEDMAGKLKVDSKEVLSLVLLTQYFDTLKEMGTNKVILFPHSPAGMGDIKQQIIEAITTAKETQQ